MQSDSYLFGINAMFIKAFTYAHLHNYSHMCAADLVPLIALRMPRALDCRSAAAV